MSEEVFRIRWIDMTEKGWYWIIEQNEILNAYKDAILEEGGDFYFYQDPATQDYILVRE
jgi:hypothetical protein